MGNLGMWLLFALAAMILVIVLAIWLSPGTAVDHALDAGLVFLADDLDGGPK